jgi:hypothetical protein
MVCCDETRGLVDDIGDIRLLMIPTIQLRRCNSSCHFLDDLCWTSQSRQANWANSRIVDDFVCRLRDLRSTSLVKMAAVGQCRMGAATGTEGVTTVPCV